jgi:hypothetical protein
MLGVIGKLVRKDVWGTLGNRPNFFVFSSNEEHKKNMTSAKNGNDSMAENSISYFNRLMKMKMISWTIYMIMEHQYLVINYF